MIMKFLVPLLLITTSLFAQNPCEDFMNLMGRSESSEQHKEFLSACGSYEETVSSDGQSKTLTSIENGITITLANSQKDKSVASEYQVSVIELNSSSGSGGYKGKLPLGFDLNMDPFAVRDLIKKNKDLSYDRSEVGLRRSYTNYSGPVNDVLQDKELRIYVSQYDKKSINIFRIRVR